MKGILYGTKGDLIVTIKGAPSQVMAVTMCKNHRIVFDGSYMILKCNSLLGDERSFKFILADAVEESLTVLLNGEVFNRILLGTRVGPVVVQKRKIIIGNKAVYKTYGYKKKGGEKYVSTKLNSGNAEIFQGSNARDFSAAEGGEPLTYESPDGGGEELSKRERDKLFD